MSENSGISSKRLRELTQKKKHAFVGYLPAGYPDRDSFFRIVQNCEKEGMSILEVGFPSDNPYDDGEVIRKAHQIADKSVKTDLSFWKDLRKRLDIPIWIMAYREDFIETGIYKEFLKEELVDGIVISKMTMENRILLKEEAADYGVDVIGFTSDEDTFSNITKTLEHFPVIYQMLYSGKTGGANNGDGYRDLLRYSEEKKENLLFGGFGVSTSERVRELISDGFYGAIIGTELLRKLNGSEEELYQFVHETADALTIE